MNPIPQRSTRVKRGTLAQLFRERRLQIGMTQLELSQRLGYRTPQGISNYERGCCDPPLARILEIGKILKLSRAEVRLHCITDIERRLFSRIKNNARTKKRS